MSRAFSNLLCAEFALLVLRPAHNLELQAALAAQYVEHGADDADHQRAQDCRREAIDVQANVKDLGEQAGEIEHASVDQQHKKAERQHDERQRQQQQHRPNRGIDQPKDQRDHSQRPPWPRQLQARDDRDRDQDRDNIDCKTQQKPLEVELLEYR